MWRDRERETERNNICLSVIINSDFFTVIESPEAHHGGTEKGKQDHTFRPKSDTFRVQSVRRHSRGLSSSRQRPHSTEARQILPRVR